MIRRWCHRSLAALLMAIGLIALSSGNAFATTPPNDHPTCGSHFAPREDYVVPSNIPALFFLDRGIYESEETALRDQIWMTSLHAVSLPAGVPETAGAYDSIAFDEKRDSRTDGILAVLKSELTPGATYQLVARHACPINGALVPAEERGETFRIGDRVELPTSIGTVTPQPQSQKYGSITIDIKPTPELRAFLPVTMLDLIVDGQLHARQIYGNIGIADDTISIQLTTSKACGVVREGSKTARVELRTHIAGAPTDPPPATMDLHVDCSVHIATGRPAEPSTAGAITPPDGACGCTVVGQANGPRATSAAAALAALGLLIGRARLRKRSARSLARRPLLAKYLRKRSARSRGDLC